MSFSVPAVADRGEARIERRDRVVRPLSRAVARACERPGCPAPAAATLHFRYSSREVWLVELAEERTPEAYDLCRRHADRTQPPQGWEIVDRRPDESDPHAAVTGDTRDADDASVTGDAARDRAARPAVRRLGGEDTVALLAAALHPVEDPPAPPVEVADPPRHEESSSAWRQGDGASPLLEPEQETTDQAPADDDVRRAFAELREVSRDRDAADLATDDEAHETEREVVPVESVEDLEELEATAEAILEALDALKRRLVGRRTGGSGADNDDGSGGADQATLW